VNASHPVRTASGQPLSLRLAMPLAVAVVAVLFLAGLAVNRFLSGSLEQELSAGEQQRLTLAAQAIGELDWDLPRGRRAVQALLFRIADPVHGRVEVVTSGGEVLFGAGLLPPDADSQQISEPIPGRDASLVIEVPRAERAVLRVFNLTLLVAGLLAVVVLIVVAALLSDRLTRPLRAVSAAARRLEQGDLSARASGGPDRESGELAVAFNAMAARVERSEMLRRRAASDMAHDLATPATVLESQLQAMVDGVIPADREQLERARASAAALSGVISQLGELVDAEAGALARHPVPTSLGELLSAAERALEPLYRERGVRLELPDPMPDAIVAVDAAQVGRAFRNVLANAAQHAPSGSQVQIGVDAAGGRVAVTVHDTGSGIDADDLPHIFERFYRADLARASGQSPTGDRSRTGAGIGLTIARELLAVNGASIEVAATGPQGTTFRMELPRAGQSG